MEDKEQPGPLGLGPEQPQCERRPKATTMPASCLTMKRASPSRLAIP